MGPELAKAILNLSDRMRTFRAIQEDEPVNQRELIILDFLKKKGPIMVSEIAEAVPSVSYSTISTDITRLWREKKMVSKTIDPENQRITIVELTPKGAEVVERVQKSRDERMHNLYKAMNTTPQEEEVIIRVAKRAVSYFDEILLTDGQKEPQK